MQAAIFGFWRYMAVRSILALLFAAFISVRGHVRMMSKTLPKGDRDSWNQVRIQVRHLAACRILFSGCPRDHGKTCLKFQTFSRC